MSCLVLAQVFTSRYEFLTREQEAALLQDITLQVGTLQVLAGPNSPAGTACRNSTWIPCTHQRAQCGHFAVCSGHADSA
jgi:hypothetical protein